MIVSTLIHILFLAMSLVAKRNRKTYNLLQEHKRKQVHLGSMRLIHINFPEKEIVNSYLDHVRENNYTDTFDKYLEVWMQDKLNEYKMTSPHPKTYGKLCAHC